MDNKCVICGEEFYEGMPIFTIKLPDGSIKAYCFGHKDSAELNEYIGSLTTPLPIIERGYVIEV